MGVSDQEAAEIQRLLGKLEADAATRRRQTQTLFDAVEDMRSKMGQMASDIRTYHEDSLAMERKLADHADILEDFKRLRAQGRGVIVGVGIASGGLAAGIMSFVNRMFG